ncbi:MAG: hypothetical protein IIW42_07190 [Bacteroidaceae bacterium]|nr:hypothetical protein [Bacteroidaceae bacterium]
MSEGRKDDDGKLRWDLLPLNLIEKVVEVYTFGVTKYEANTWQNLKDGYNRCKAAMFRHLVAHERGETVDDESGLPALAHMVWNAIAMMHFAMKDKKITFDIRCKDEASPLLKELQQYAVNVSLSHVDECGERGEQGISPNVGQYVAFEIEWENGIKTGIGEITEYRMTQKREFFIVREENSFGEPKYCQLDREDIKEIIK